MFRPYMHDPYASRPAGSRAPSLCKSHQMITRHSCACQVALVHMNFANKGARWVPDEFTVLGQSLVRLGFGPGPLPNMTKAQAICVHADILFHHPTFPRSANSVRVHAKYDPRVAGLEFIRRSERVLAQRDVAEAQRDVAVTGLAVAVNDVFDADEEIEQLDEEIDDLREKIRADQQRLNEKIREKDAAVQRQETAEATADQLLKDKRALETENTVLKEKNETLKEEVEAEKKQKVARRPARPCALPVAHTT